MHSLASPFWQGMFFLGAGLYLLWEIFVGWRRGVVRGAVYFGAFVLSGFVGYVAGRAAYTIWGKLFPGTAFLAGLATGALALLFVLVFCLLLGALLFKRTSQQSSAMVRLLFGGGGALFGLLLGLAVLWGAISIVRVAGTMAESPISGHPAAEAPGILRSFAILKESIELGSAGKFVESVDIVPPQTYKMITQVGKVVSDRATMVRFLDYPGVQEIIQNPRMIRLLEDPALKNHNLPDLITGQSLLDAANDPALTKQLKNVDLQKALDYAVPSAEASPSPKKKKP